MPPRTNTRYQYSRAFQDEFENWFLEVPAPFRFTNEIDNSSYTIKAGDNLQIIAYRSYRGFQFAPQLWRAIAEFNDIIDATVPLVAGNMLVIPSLRWINDVYFSPPEDFRRTLALISS